MRALIDTGPIVAYYNAGDNWHSAAQSFLNSFHGQFVTTYPIVTEVMWLLGASWLVQNEFLKDLKNRLFEVEPIHPIDFARIAELNEKYADLPADFADLSIIALSERLDIEDIASFDDDFEIYRRFGRKRFKQIFPREKRTRR